MRPGLESGSICSHSRSKALDDFSVLGLRYPDDGQCAVQAQLFGSDNDSGLVEPPPQGGPTEADNGQIDRSHPLAGMIGGGPGKKTDRSSFAQRARPAALRLLLGD